VDASSNTYQYMIFTNLTAQSAPPAFQAFMLENVMRQITGKNSLTFTIGNEPMPMTAEDKRAF